MAEQPGLELSKYLKKQTEICHRFRLFFAVPLPSIVRITMNVVADIAVLE